MRARIIAPAVAATVVLVGGASASGHLGGASAGADAGSRAVGEDADRSGHRRTFELLGTTASETFVDVEPKQALPTDPPGPGDMFLGSDTLRSRTTGKAAGTFVFSCSVVTPEYSLCHGTFDLPRGQIAAQVAFRPTAYGEEGLTAAIIGGTGAYRRAHGTLRQVTLPDGTDVFSFRLE